MSTHCRTRIVSASGLTVAALILGGVGAWIAPGDAQAQAQTCIQDRWKAAGNNQNLTCTANDVRIAEATNIRDLNGDPLTSCNNGIPFSFVADFRTVLGAQARYDIGLYFATDGDPNGNGAISGACSTSIITPKSLAPPFLGSANFVQLDSTSQPQDICGDINAANNPQIVTVQVDNVLCQDSDGDGKLNLPNCTSWRQGGANDTCTSVADAFPGSPSKCNCDPDFNIDVDVEIGTIEVTKTAAPASRPEPGGEFTFTVHVQNLAKFTPIDINRICDSDHGVVFDMTATGCPAGTVTPSPTGTDCVPVTLAPDDEAPGGFDEYTCTFTADIFSDTPLPNEQDTVTVFGIDQSPNMNPVQASDTASIAITDALPMAMVTKEFEGINCVNVTYEVSVENTSTADALTLTVLNDTAFGNLTQVQGDITDTDCAVPQDIPVGQTYACSFDADFCSGVPTNLVSHTNKAQATLNDNENNSVTPESATVQVDVSGTQQ